jgi:hypothetical protein
MYFNLRELGFVDVHPGLQILFLLRQFLDVAKLLMFGLVLRDFFSG